MFDHEDLIFEVYLVRHGISEEERTIHSEEVRAELCKKEHPCLRASSLTKRYGWGAHYNDEGKIALYAVDSDEYQHLVEACSKQLFGMRTKHKK